MQPLKRHCDDELSGQPEQKLFANNVRFSCVGARATSQQVEGRPQATRKGRPKGTGKACLGEPDCLYKRIKRHSDACCLAAALLASRGHSTLPFAGLRPLGMDGGGASFGLMGGVASAPAEVSTSFGLHNVPVAQRALGGPPGYGAPLETPAGAVPLVPPDGAVPFVSTQGGAGAFVAPPGSAPFVSTPGAVPFVATVSTPGAVPCVATPGAAPFVSNPGAAPCVATPGVAPFVATPSVAPFVSTPCAVPLWRPNVALGLWQARTRAETL